MGQKQSISDYTEAEFLAFVKQIFNVENTTEEEDVKNILEFERLVKHPDGADLIYYPNDNREDSPEGVVKEVKEWLAKNNNPGFKKG
ncbi:MAG: bacteriocin immunity protein [Proteus mirabilis]|nr:bacteriocin immunity protein [Proteus mirabilis]